MHLILHFYQKVAIFALKRVILLLFVPTLFFGFRAVFSLQASSKISGQTSLYQPWLSPYCLFKDQLEINLAAMPRGFESHRLRQRQHPAGCCLLFLRQTMQGLQGGIRTARAWRFASSRAATVLRTVARARENPTACAKYHYSILHWVVIFLLLVCKIPLEAYIVSGVFWYK